MVPTPLTEKTILTPLNCFCTSAKKQRAVFSALFRCSSVHLFANTSVLIPVTLKLCLRIKSNDPSNFRTPLCEKNYFSKYLSHLPEQNVLHLKDQSKRAPPSQQSSGNHWVAAVVLCKQLTAGQSQTKDLSHQIQLLGTHLTSLPPFSAYFTF